MVIIAMIQIMAITTMMISMDPIAGITQVHMTTTTMIPMAHRNLNTRNMMVWMFIMVLGAHTTILCTIHKVTTAFSKTHIHTTNFIQMATATILGIIQILATTMTQLAMKFGILRRLTTHSIVIILEHIGSCIAILIMILTVDLHLR
tara:strand:- start:2247 stop:2687 length:441 start_codon:yes stop_codon:yes gene_type:complete